jgi:hypothetical protein
VRLVVAGGAACTAVAVSTSITAVAEANNLRPNIP